MLRRRQERDLRHRNKNVRCSDRLSADSGFTRADVFGHQQRARESCIIDGLIKGESLEGHAIRIYATVGWHRAKLSEGHAHSTQPLSHVCT